jgi:hypothetical protein
MTWRQHSLYEAKAFYEVKGSAANNEFRIVTFDELWNLDCIKQPWKMNNILDESRTYEYLFFEKIDF